MTNRAAWEAASTKYQSDPGPVPLEDAELELLAPILATGPLVVHLQSGNGTDDHALVAAGARAVVGVDFSAVATRSAQRRAEAPIRYVVASLPGAPLAGGRADLVYTGKGALIWMTDLDVWAADVARLLRPGEHFFAYETHPAVPLWTWDADEPRIRADRSYFASAFVNDTFPGNGAVEHQWTLGQIVTALIGAGLAIRHLEEFAEPFYRYGGVDAAAWRGRLPNAYALLARKVSVR